jgi:U3 small nucleolar RNA-associated protein 18
LKVFEIVSVLTFFIAIFSSSSGFVNVYGSDSFAIPRHSETETTFSSSATKNPKLAKALGHLTTPISTLRFNHDAQILAMASKEKKDAMRLVRLYPYSVFSIHAK